ncbi:AGAP008862-PA-like protein [Anopheles sinensis]|uniref:AGAP008862-PA-like protein n=1 Tax=Anopheles sinensis TaxID=74873 RepID=A0A084VYK5_ANOSI|nr:AGAP008862-PA-like protein [Anopheles sinensis]
MDRAETSESVSDQAESGYQTGSTPNTQPTQSSHSSAGASHGRGRAMLVDRVKERQQNSGIVQEQHSQKTTVIGRARFVQMIMDRSEQQGSKDATAEVTARMQTASLEQKEPPGKPQSKPTPSAVELPKALPTEPVVRMGTSGTSTKLLCNFMELRCEPNRGMFLYTVDFDPVLESKKERYKCLEENVHIFGKTHTFDGTLLMMPQALPQKLTVIDMKRPLEGSPVRLTVTFRAQKRMSENVMFYNKLFRRIMGILQLTEIGRKNFDPTQARIVPQHKLEVWPGYVTAVNEFEGGLMLNLDITHRVLMQTTVYDHIKMTALASPNQFRDNLLKSLLGVVVFTRYNKKTYRIDDVCFDTNPMSTFKYGDRDITYVEYYKRQYGIDVLDHNQPLLLHRAERRVAGKEQPEQQLVCLVPEICYLTGLTDEMRSDFKVMRDIATYTRVSPNQRMASMEQFCKNVNSNEKARTLLASWGLELKTQIRPVIGRTLPNETIRFGNDATTSAGPMADFNNQITNNHMLRVVNITNWMLVHTSRDTRAATTFVDCVNRNCRLVGINISPPQREMLQQDSTQSYVQLLRSRVRPETQIVVIIFPTAREDRYAAVKRLCCSELPVPSQVINARTLMNDKKVRAIVLKIILQMNCKLGGSLWGVNIPLSDTMICGIDTYHETKRQNASVAAFVGSLSPDFTQWYSRATIQSCKEEFMNGLCASFEKTLFAYRGRNSHLPQRVIIFRDGVSDSQIRMCEEYELPQLLAACEAVQPGYKPKITFIIVQKRIITRMFSMNGADGSFGNPPPGTVLDHTVTRRYLYDFFLVSQSVRQGTVSPTHFVILRDDSSFSPDILQRLAYKMCYMYYNWPGTVRVPACCQYAHKLAYLVGQSVKRQPSESLCDKLFYL